MGIYKRGEVYWYKFMWQGASVRESTKQGNDKVARQMEAAHRTSWPRVKWVLGTRRRFPLWLSLSRSVLHLGHSPPLAKRHGLTITDLDFE